MDACLVDKLEGRENTYTKRHVDYKEHGWHAVHTGIYTGNIVHTGQMMKSSNMQGL